MTGLKDIAANKRAELEHAPPPPAAPTAGFGEVNRERVLAIVGLDPRDPKAHAVVAVAERYGLDPVLGHIQIISNSKMPYISRDGFLFIAHRSGQLDGIEVVDGPRRDGAEWVARVAVYRKDMSRAFVYPGRAELGRDNGPEMALARAERRALKRAFAVTLPKEFAEDEHDPRADTETPAASNGPPPARPAPEQELAPEPGEATGPEPDVEMITQSQVRAMHAAFRELGIGDREERLTITRQFIGREIGTANELYRAEATALLHELADRKQRAAESAAARQAVEESQSGDEPGLLEVELPEPDTET